MTRSAFSQSCITGELSPPSPRWVWFITATCSLLVALPWLWPVLYGPSFEMVPNILAWASASVLFVLLPLGQERAEVGVVAGWLLAASISSLIGLLQFFDLESAFSPWVVVTRQGEVLANVHQVNLLSTLLAVGLLSLWWMYVNRFLKSWVSISIAFLLIIGLAATASRTGMVHVILVSVLLVLWGKATQRSWVVVLVGLTAYTMAALTLPWIQELMGVDSNRNLIGRFGNQSPCFSRLVIWSNVLQLISLKPLMGWGWDGLTYAHYITAFEGPRFCEKLSHAHNLPLQFAVSLGLPVAVIVVFLIFIAIYKLKPWKATCSSERLAWGILVLLGFHSLVEYPLWFGIPQVMAALAVWMIWRSRQPYSPNGYRKPVVNMAFANRAVAAGLILLALTYVAWDYFRVTQLFIVPSHRHHSYQVDTLAKAKSTWLFQSYLLYSVVNTTSVDADNAGMVLDSALEVLKIFPDPEIIIKVIASAKLTGNTELEKLHTERFRAAWPKAFEKWKASE